MCYPAVHDDQLGVIEAMLGKFSTEEPGAIAAAFGGSAGTIGAGGAANIANTPGAAAAAAASGAAPAAAAGSAAARPNAENRSHLEAVAARINNLEATTKAMAEQAKAETEALMVCGGGTTSFYLLARSPSSRRSVRSPLSCALFCAPQNLQKQTKAENERLLQALEAKAGSVLDVAIDATHAVLTHTPHAEGQHNAAPNAASPPSKVSN
jgi:hypothetical protein